MTSLRGGARGELPRNEADGDHAVRCKEWSASRFVLLGLRRQDPDSVRHADGNSIEAVYHGSLRAGGVIDHLWLRAADIASSRRFYEVVAPHAGLRWRNLSPEHVQLMGASGSFSVVAGPPTRNLHMAFPAATNAAVDEFHRAATSAGYRDDGPPGERLAYHPGYYAAFVLDPDGNSIELGNHNREAAGV